MTVSKERRMPVIAWRRKLIHPFTITSLQLGFVFLHPNMPQRSCFTRINEVTQEVRISYVKGEETLRAGQLFRD